MPIYEYCCEECGNRFEELVMSSTAADEVACPACDSSRVQRLISGFAFKSSGSPASGDAGGSSKNCGPCSKSSCSSCG